jgi:hypothetical protein
MWMSTQGPTIGRGAPHSDAPPGSLDYGSLPATMSMNSAREASCSPSTAKSNRCKDPGQGALGKSDQHGGFHPGPPPANGHQRLPSTHREPQGR